MALRGALASPSPSPSPLVLLLLLHLTLSAAQLPATSPWGYRCQEGQCLKEEGGPLTLAQCKVGCGPLGALWPAPASASLAAATLPFLPSAVTLKHTAPPPADQLLIDAFAIFLGNLERYHPEYAAGGATPWNRGQDPEVERRRVEVEVKVEAADQWLTLATNESYSLRVTTAGDLTTATITAPTFFGARHGLETLAQLAAYNERLDSLLMVNGADVSDAPAFPYRGLLIDTSRNFVSIPVLERTIDAMAANKLNTLHWHITDSHSFPLNLTSLPNMVFYGAYSPREVYQPQEVRDLVKYARIRGVRVLPEFDAPAHVGHGWQWGEKHGLGKLAVCVDKEPWQLYCVEPPCGQLNLANPNIYEVLAKIYTEMVDLFQPIDLFHYGGDEVNVNCWNTTDEMTSWMKSNNYGLSHDSYYHQWSVFQEKSRHLLNKANNGTPVPGILWTSHLTEKGNVDRYLDPNHYIIQIWTTGKDPVIKELLNKGYRVIFSNYDSWYLDCGAGAWVGDGNNWCSPYKGWQTVYDNSPHTHAASLTGSTHDDLILGGEAALWTEQVDDATVDAKLWPRGAALAERLWTNPSTNWAEAEWRFINHRQRLVERGVAADRIQPQWCHQNEGFCYINKALG